MLSSQSKKGATLTFRHFNRKGYALFSCLGREVRVGVLGVATLLSATPRLMAATGCSVEGGDTLASHLDDNDTRLDEAVVSASRAPLATDVVARQVMTLTRRDLAAAGVTSINDVLKLAAGVDVRQRGGFGVQTDLSVDGGTFDQLTILVNGVAVNNPQSGHNAADFPLNLDDIERIEILQGASSRVFGSQAFSGAVNVVTRHGGSPLSLSVQGGSYGTLLAEDARLGKSVRASPLRPPSVIAVPMVPSKTEVSAASKPSGKGITKMRPSNSKRRPASRRKTSAPTPSILVPIPTSGKPRGAIS